MLCNGLRYSVGQPCCSSSSLSVSLLALLTCLCVFSTAEAAYHTAVYFEEAGQVCPRPSEAQRLREALSQLPPMAESPITLVAYSDQIEMRQPRWQADVGCLKTQVPEFLTGHERIAWLRAMSLVELLRDRGIQGFQRPPRLVVGPDASYVNQDTQELAIVLQRSGSVGRSERRVDIIWHHDGTSASGSNGASSPIMIASIPTMYPQTSGKDLLAASVGINGRPTDHLRTSGIALIGVGITSIVLGLGFFGAAGYYHSESISQYETSQREASDARAQPFWHAGGWTLGVGVGAAVVGASFILAARRSSDAKPRLLASTGSGN